MSRADYLSRRLRINRPSLLSTTRPFLLGSLPKMSQGWNCTLCAFLSLFLSQLLTHLNTEHRDDMNFKQNCGLPDCLSNTEYSSINSFIKQVHSSHCTILNCTHEAVFNLVEDSEVTDAYESGKKCANASYGYPVTGDPFLFFIRPTPSLFPYPASLLQRLKSNPTGTM